MGLANRPHLHSVPGEMVRQARILAQATSDLVNAIKADAEGETDLENSRKLLSAAKILADATAKMVEAAKVSVGKNGCWLWPQPCQMLLAQCWVGDEQPLVEQQFAKQDLALSQGPVGWAPPVKELQEAVGSSRGVVTSLVNKLFQRGFEHFLSTINKAALWGPEQRYCFRRKRDSMVPERCDEFSLFSRELQPTQTARSSSSGCVRQQKGCAWQPMLQPRTPSRRSLCTSWR